MFVNVAKQGFYRADNSIFAIITVSLVKLDPWLLDSAWKLSCSLFQVNAYTDFTLWSRGPTHAKISVKFIGFCHQ